MSTYGLIYDACITAAIFGAYCLGRYDREAARLVFKDLRNVDLADEPVFLEDQQVAGEDLAEPDRPAILDVK